MNILRRMMEEAPVIEVAIRKIYRGIKESAIMHNNSVIRLKRGISGNKAPEKGSGNWEIYSAEIEKLGINKGDILIVHSSFDGLKKFELDYRLVFEYLRSLVGEEGTLVMPAFPLYKKKNNANKRFDEIEEEVLKYKPKTSISWTGMLPNYMCSLNEAERSLFPMDTLVAVGKEASIMMKDNLTAITSHGKMSAWDYCNNHHAKVLYLGISPVHCLSEIHIFEDSNIEEWPIRGWYKNQKFIIEHEKASKEFTCYSRKQFWNQYITENYCMKKLMDSGVLDYKVVENTPMGYVSDLSKMTGFVSQSVKNGDLLFWRIPKKYWKE